MKRYVLSLLLVVIATDPTFLRVLHIVRPSSLRPPSLTAPVCSNNVRYVDPRAKLSYEYDHIAAVSPCRIIATTRTQVPKQSAYPDLS